MSSRRRRGSGGDPRRQARRPARTPDGPDGPPERPSGGLGLAAQIGILVAIFLVVSAIAELAGAANLGVAIGVGQIAFAIAVVWMLLRGP